MIAWLADSGSWGPLTRAIAVLRHTPGFVVGYRAPRDWEPCDREGIGHVSFDCCGVPAARQLAELPADLLVADPSWWEVAVADGRPCVRLGWASSGAPDWDLDAGPIHPWADGLPLTRGAVRELWGVGPETPVVATLSNRRYRNIIENRVADSVPEGARLVSLSGWGAAERMVGADLVVATAGWASSVECRWTGVPHCLLDVGGPDGWPRVTHTVDEARRAVAAVSPWPSPSDWAGAPNRRPLTEFLALAERSALRHVQWSR